jgi:hypothetical protein
MKSASILTSGLYFQIIAMYATGLIPVPGKLTFDLTYVNMPLGSFLMVREPLHLAAGVKVN